MNQSRHSQDSLLKLFNPAEEQAQLRRLLNIILPSEYIQLFHCRNVYATTLLNHTSLVYDERTQRQRTAKSGSRLGVSETMKWEASSEPATRSYVLNLMKLFDSTLEEKRAKPIGLCSIRRSIYDQCFDELIRQVTVGCLEQGILLFRIRNEFRMTLNNYRRAYESAVAFGASKSIDIELELEANRKIAAKLESQLKEERLAMQHEKVDKINSDASIGHNDLLQRTQEYFEGELVKKEQIIKRQRDIIEALSQTSVEQIKSPL